MRRVPLFLLLTTLLIGLPAMAQEPREERIRPAGLPETSESAQSFPPDKTDYVRELVSGDANPLGDVSGAFAPSVFLRNLVVSNTDPTLFANDTAGDSEPSIAINPNDPDEIVILAFSGTSGGNAPVWHSTDGGNTWSKLFTMAGTTTSGGITCDQAPDWGNTGILAVTHLTCGGGTQDIVTGTTTDPTQIANWNWADDGDATAEVVNEVGANSSDQPWLLVAPDPSNLSQDIVHNAYDDFTGSPDMRVVSDDFADPTSFEVGDDKLVGNSTGSINPGHRQAKDIRTGYIYSGWQRCVANCGTSLKNIDYMLNRSTDGGATWILNGSGTGIIAANGNSVQPTPKFGTVNALLGGVIHLAVDPNLGHVYLAYGSHDGTNMRISLRRFQDDGSGTIATALTNTNFTPAGKDAALPSVAVASDGTVGVFYYTFDGFSSDSFPIFTAWLGLSGDEGATFTHKKLLTFLSSAQDNSNNRQRVLGDYVQLKTVGRTFYGTFTGNGAPFGRPVSNHDPYFYKETVGPILTVEAPNDFGQMCVGGLQTKKLEISNTGWDPLVIHSVTKLSGDPDISLLPNPATPLTIQPTAEVGFDVECRGLTFGTKTATIRIDSNDPDQPILDIEYTCSVTEPEIQTTFLPSGNYGNVCLGDTKTYDLTIQNSGGCALSVSNIVSNSAEFLVGSVATFPVSIASGDSLSVPIEFAPAGDVGAAAGTITVSSNDSDEGSLVIPVSGNSPAATLDLFVADSGNFGNVCSGDFKDLNVTVQNNGACPLELTALSLPVNDQGDFELPSGNAADSQLEPNNSLQLPIRFAPDSFTPAGTRNGTLQADGRTLLATTTLQDTQALTGTAPPPNINVPANGADPIDIDFGNVCAGVSSDINIPVCNTGLCTLNVTSATLEAFGGGGPCLDFTIVQNPFPDLVSHDFCMDVVVRYTPTTGEGTHQCQLVIESDSPGESPIIIGIEGTTPTTVIDVPGDMSFSPEVVNQVDECSTLQPFPVSNNGLCPLQITDMVITDLENEYLLDGVPSLPTFLQSGHVFGAGDLDVEFKPFEPLERWKIGELTVSYVSDSVTGATTDVDVNLCGEGTYTGARVLVTDTSGNAFSTVERIQIQRITANRNRRPRLDTVSVLRNVPLTTVTPPGGAEYTACQEFEYHAEYGTVSNGNQLLPGVYQVNATVRIGGRRYTKSVGFSVNACDFNPTVIITF